MVQKRCVSLVLLLLVIGLSFSALSIDSSQSENYALYHCNDNQGDGQGCGGNGVNIIKPVSLATRSSFAICDPGHDNYNFQKYDYPSDNGCWFAAAGIPGNDESVWATLVEGTILQPWKTSQIFHQSGGTISASFIDAIYQEGSSKYYDVNLNVISSAENEVSCFMPSLENDGWWIGGAYLLDLQSEGAAICAEDHMWHECKGGEGGNEGKITWANDHLYRCQQDDYRWIWYILGRDQDHDGYIASSTDSTIPIDCADNPSAAGLRTEGCPENSDGCQYPRDSKCALCINPSSPEICGDGINNDCRGNGREFDAAANELEGATPDSCDIFKQGCEARGDNFLMDGEEYINEEGETISVDERLPRAYGNAQGQQFSWTDTPEGGLCCGYNGITDLGNLNADSSRICLKDDNELVGLDVPPTEDPDTYSVKDAVTWNEDACQGDWCWIPASGNAGGKILTMKKLGTPAYDVVSNEHRWYACNEESFLGTLATAAMTDDTKKLMNRFACYQEGDHWSWAECTLDDFRNPSVKARHGGDALYSLYLGPNGKKAGGSVQIKADAGPGEDDGGFGHIYERSTGEAVYFDFTGYDTLEFFFKFWQGGTEDGMPISSEGLRLPVGLTLTLYGPEEQEYFSQDVLGNIINNPVFSGDPLQWNHVQVKIPADLQLVSGIAISSSNPDDTPIIVQNVFLSKSDNPATDIDESQTALCAGKDSSNAPNWLTSFDDYQSSVLNGKEMCIAHYGPSAWLGVADNLEAANCCGNSPNEYYAGPVAESTGATEAARYGCWNSQTIQEGSTVMNVGVDVVSGVEERSFEYPNVIFNLHWKVNSLTTILSGRELIDFLEGIDFFETSEDYTLNVENQDILIDTITVPNGQIFDKLSVNALYLTAERLPLVQLYFYDPVTGTDLGNELAYDETERILEVRARLLLDSTRLIFNPIVIPLLLIAGEYPISVDQSVNGIIFHPSFPCSSSECLFPLKGGDVIITGTMIDSLEITGTVEEITAQKGEMNTALTSVTNPLYLLRNPRPDLYELYFVDESIISRGRTNLETATLLTSQWQAFTTKGNLLARRVAQQVIYVNQDDPTPDDDEETLDMKFYGCQAPLSIENTPTSLPEILLSSTGYFENLPYCSQKANAFCSPSLTNTSEGLTTINTWSTEEAPQGYELDTTYTLETEEDLDLLPEALTLKTEKIPVTDRKFAVSAVPGRNLIPNAEFKDLKAGSLKDLRYWELFQGTTPLPNSEESQITSTIDITGATTNTFTLNAGQTMKSSRIAIPQNTVLHFSYEGACSEEIIKLLNKEGEELVNSLEFTTIPERPSSTDPLAITAPLQEVLFPTETATSILLEFTSDSICTITHPMLQILDETPVPFNYISRVPDKSLPRAGLACCPEAYCWNGYACIAPMQDSTLQAEHLPDGRNYRCMNGVWADSPLQSDWNGQNVGFCQQEQQCFVLSSQADDASLSTDSQPIVANTSNEERNFLNFHDQTLQAKFPTCINDKEYIMDNYCDEGEWASRTKYVASNLLQAADSEYALYCTKPQDNLPDVAGNERFIYGSNSESAGGSNPLGRATITGTPATCFQTSADIKGTLNNPGLLPDRDNTCINSVCLLQHDNKLVLGTTLNKPLDVEQNPDSFLLALGITDSESCAGEPDSEGVITCTTSEGELQYIPELQMVIYGKDGITPGFSFERAVDALVELFQSLLGRETELSAATAFLNERQNFRDIYLLDVDGKQVRAVKEILPKEQRAVPHVIVAEFENFETPLCQYINKQLLEKMNPAFANQLLQTPKVACKVDGSKQIAEIKVGEGSAAALDEFWPELTAKLRPQG